MPAIRSVHPAAASPDRANAVSPTPVCFYEKGAWGPPEADELIAPRKWHVTGVHDAHDYMSRAYPIVPEG